MNPIRLLIMKLDKKSDTDSFGRQFHNLIFLNHFHDFLLGIGIVFNVALGGGKGGMSSQHTDVV